VTYSGDTMPCDALVELGTYIRPERKHGKGNTLVYICGLWRQCNRLSSLQFFFLASENFKPLFFGIFVTFFVGLILLPCV
jgi:hypothetical protein